MRRQRQIENGATYTLAGSGWEGGRAPNCVARFF
jgi:hypothetical protein